MAHRLRQLQSNGKFHAQQFIIISINWRKKKMKNKEKYLTDFSEAKRKKAIQKYDVVNKYEHEHSKNFSNSFQDIELIIIDEIDRLKVQNLEQQRNIYDQHNLAMIFIGMPGIEKKLSRYPQLYSRIGFAHEFDNLSKDETHHILEYKWQDLGDDLKLEDFTDYEAITTIIKITKGDFRLIHRLFAQIDRIMDINDLDKISTEVVETARDSLVIGIR